MSRIPKRLAEKIAETAGIPWNSNDGRVWNFEGHPVFKKYSQGAKINIRITKNERVEGGWEWKLYSWKRGPDNGPIVFEDFDISEIEYLLLQVDRKSVEASVDEDEIIFSVEPVNAKVKDNLEGSKYAYRGETKRFGIEKLLYQFNVGANHGEGLLIRNLEIINGVLYDLDLYSANNNLEVDSIIRNDLQHYDEEIFEPVSTYADDELNLSRFSFNKDSMFYDPGMRQSWGEIKNAKRNIRGKKDPTMEEWIDIISKTKNLSLKKKRLFLQALSKAGEQSDDGVIPVEMLEGFIADGRIGRSYDPHERYTRHVSYEPNKKEKITSAHEIIDEIEFELLSRDEGFLSHGSSRAKREQEISDLHNLRMNSPAMTDEHGERVTDIGTEGFYVDGDGYVMDVDADQVDEFRLSERGQLIRFDPERGRLLDAHGDKVPYEVMDGIRYTTSGHHYNETEEPEEEAYEHMSSNAGYINYSLKPKMDPAVAAEMDSIDLFGRYARSDQIYPDERTPISEAAARYFRETGVNLIGGDYDTAGAARYFEIIKFGGTLEGLVHAPLGERAMAAYAYGIETPGNANVAHFSPLVIPNNNERYGKGEIDPGAPLSPVLYHIRGHMYVDRDFTNTMLLSEFQSDYGTFGNSGDMMPTEVNPIAPYRDDPRNNYIEANENVQRHLDRFVSMGLGPSGRWEYFDPERRREQGTVRRYSQAVRIALDKMLRENRIDLPGRAKNSISWTRDGLYQLILSARMHGVDRIILPMDDDLMDRTIVGEGSLPSDLFDEGGVARVSRAGTSNKYNDDINAPTLIWSNKYRRWFNFNETKVKSVLGNDGWSAVHQDEIPDDWEAFYSNEFMRENIILEKEFGGELSFYQLGQNMRRRKTDPEKLYYANIGRELMTMLKPMEGVRMRHGLYGSHLMGGDAARTGIFQGIPDTDREWVGSGWMKAPMPSLYLDFNDVEGWGDVTRPLPLDLFGKSGLTAKIPEGMADEPMLHRARKMHEKK